MIAMDSRGTSAASICAVHLSAAFSTKVSNVRQSYTGASDLRGVAVSK